MDNISKAIVFAGSVFISVLIISISISLYTNFKSFATKSADAILVRDVNTFNSFFVNYVDEIHGYDVYNIIGKVIDINLDEDIEREINVSLSTKEKKYLSNSVSPDELRDFRLNYFYFTENLDDYENRKPQYTISYGYDDNGYILSISISKKE